MSSLEKYKETSTLEIIKNQWKEFIKLFLKKEQIDIEEQQREEERKEFLELVYKARRIGRNPKTILRMYPIGFGRQHTPYGSR